MPFATTPSHIGDNTRLAHPHISQGLTDVIFISHWKQNFPAWCLADAITMSREKDLDDISFIVIEFPKRKKLDFFVHSAHTIWGAMEKEVVESHWVENFPFLVFVFKAGWCQVPIWNEGNHKEDQDWKCAGQNPTNSTTNFKCPRAHTDPQIFWQRPSDQVLFFKSIARRPGPARHTACGISFMKLSLVLCLHRKSLMSLMPCPTSPMSLTLKLKLSSVLVLLINSHCLWCCIAWASNS